MWLSVRLLANLKRYTGGRTDIDLEVVSGVSLGVVMDGLGIPRGEVGVALINGRLASDDTILSEGDCVELVPAVCGGGAPESVEKRR